MDHARSHSHSHSLRGESSKPIRYNPVPIGGPNRPPVTQSPANPARRNNHPERSSSNNLDHSPVNVNVNVKREPAAATREGPDYQSEPPPSAVTDYTERSSSAYPESGGNGVKSDDGADADDGPQKKRQKRNKPTLSCFECVERKTKVAPAFLSFFFFLRAVVNEYSSHSLTHSQTHTHMLTFSTVRPRPAKLPGLHKEADRV